MANPPGSNVQKVPAGTQTPKKEDDSLTTATSELSLNDAQDTWSNETGERALDRSAKDDDEEEEEEEEESLELNDEFHQWFDKVQREIKREENAVDAPPVRDINKEMDENEAVVADIKRNYPEETKLMSPLNILAWNAKMSETGARPPPEQYRDLSEHRIGFRVISDEDLRGRASAQSRAVILSPKRRDKTVHGMFSHPTQVHSAVDSVLPNSLLPFSFGKRSGEFTRAEEVYDLEWSDSELVGISETQGARAVPESNLKGSKKGGGSGSIFHTTTTGYDATDEGDHTESEEPQKDKPGQTAPAKPDSADTPSKKQMTTTENSLPPPATAFTIRVQRSNQDRFIHHLVRVDLHDTYTALVARIRKTLFGDRTMAISHLDVCWMTDSDWSAHRGGEWSSQTPFTYTRVDAHNVGEVLEMLHLRKTRDYVFVECRAMEADVSRPEGWSGQADCYDAAVDVYEEYLYGADGRPVAEGGSGVGGSTADAGGK